MALIRYESDFEFELRLTVKHWDITVVTGVGLWSTLGTGGEIDHSHIWLWIRIGMDGQNSRYWNGMVIRRS